MPMRNPPHPGALIRDCLDEFSLSVSDAARGIGVTRQQLHNIISGRSGISPEMALRLEKAFGGTAEQWLRVQQAHDLARVREREHEITVRSFRRRAA